MTTSNNTVSIYVGTYQKYNNGSINGEWVDLSDYSSLDDFYDYCKELHKDESDPEFMFQDREGEGHATFVSESHINERVFEFLELDDQEKMRISYLCENVGYDIELAMEKQADLYVLDCDYEHEAPQAYYDWLIEIGSIDEQALGSIAYYIDKEALYNGDGNDFTFYKGLGLVRAEGL